MDGFEGRPVGGLKVVFEQGQISPSPTKPELRVDVARSTWHMKGFPFSSCENEAQTSLFVFWRSYHQVAFVAGNQIASQQGL